MKSTDIIKASANSLNIYSFTAEALERLIEAVKAEQPCQTCEALARTVMLDQTSHDTSPPASKPWVGLTDEEKMMCWSRATCDADVEHKTEHQCLIDYAFEVEAKLQEKNA